MYLQYNLSHAHHVNKYQIVWPIKVPSDQSELDVIHLPNLHRLSHIVLSPVLCLGNPITNNLILRGYNQFSLMSNPSPCQQT